MNVLESDNKNIRESEMV